MLGVVGTLNVVMRKSPSSTWPKREMEMLPLRRSRGRSATVARALDSMGRGDEDDSRDSSSSCAFSSSSCARASSAWARRALSCSSFWNIWRCCYCCWISRQYGSCRVRRRRACERSGGRGRTVIVLHAPSRETLDVRPWLRRRREWAQMDDRARGEGERERENEERRDRGPGRVRVTRVR